MSAALATRRGSRLQPLVRAVVGLYALPTPINNAETIATVPKILELGGADYATLGVANSAGTRVFPLSGDVVRPDNYELPLGTPLRELIYEPGAASPTGAR